jgi:hypothetical protein
MRYTKISSYWFKFGFPSACFYRDGLLQGVYIVASNVKLMDFIDCKQYNDYIEKLREIWSFNRIVIELSSNLGCST